eukprot:140468-Chlamydomonas_euryale.AAC.4
MAPGAGTAAGGSAGGGGDAGRQGRRALRSASPDRGLGRRGSAGGAARSASRERHHPPQHHHHRAGSSGATDAAHVADRSRLHRVGSEQNLRGRATGQHGSHGLHGAANSARSPSSSLSGANAHHHHQHNQQQQRRQARGSNLRRNSGASASSAMARLEQGYSAAGHTVAGRPSLPERRTTSGRPSIPDSNPDAQIMQSHAGQLGPRKRECQRVCRGVAVCA